MGWIKRRHVCHIFERYQKDIGEECLVQMHLVGCLSCYQTIKPLVFITYPNIHNDPNLTVTVIQRVLHTWQGILPPVLYVQLEYASGEMHIQKDKGQLLTSSAYI